MKIVIETNCSSTAMKPSQAPRRCSTGCKGRPSRSPRKARLLEEFRKTLAALRRLLNPPSGVYLYRCVLQGDGLARLLGLARLTPPAGTLPRIGLIGEAEFASALPILGRELAEGISTGRLNGSGTMCISAETLPPSPDGRCRAAVTVAPIRAIHLLPAWRSIPPHFCPCLSCTNFTTARPKGPRCHKRRNRI